MSNCGLAYPAYLNDVLQTVLDSVCDCLDNTTLGTPKDCFISHRQPPDDCCDFLAIWIDRLLPTFEFPDVSFRVERCGDVRRMADISLRLVRPCWPTLKDNANSPFPTPAEMQAAAESLLIDANVLWCCLSDTFAAGLGCDNLNGCLDAIIEELVMDDPRGGCAGMTMTFRLELEGCC
jgi:hypothetical protein